MTVVSCFHVWSAGSRGSQETESGAVWGKEVEKKKGQQQEMKKKTLSLGSFGPRTETFIQEGLQEGLELLYPGGSGALSSLASLE